MQCTYILPWAGPEDTRASNICIIGRLRLPDNEFKFAHGCNSLSLLSLITKAPVQELEYESHLC